MKAQCCEVGSGRNTWTKGGLASSVVEALADPANNVRTFKSMQSLHNGRWRKIGKIGVTPVALTAALDAHNWGTLARTPASGSREAAGRRVRRRAGRNTHA